MNQKPFANLKNMLDTAAGKPKHTTHGTMQQSWVKPNDPTAGDRMNDMMRPREFGERGAELAQRSDWEREQIEAERVAMLQEVQESLWSSIPFGSHAKDVK